MTTDVQASCLCGQLVVTSNVPNSKLPLDLYLCSCDTCRYLSGTLAISSVNLHHPISIIGKFTRYATSKGPRGLDRCFCPVCGTYVFEDCPDVGRIGLFGGAIENVDAELVKFRGTIYAASTRDGGLATWIPDHTAWVTDFKGEDTKEWIPPRKPNISKQEIDPAATLQCLCLCESVQFEITRPDESSYNISAQRSDSLKHVGSNPTESNPTESNPTESNPTESNPTESNLEDGKWWIRGDSEIKKYAAAVCACDTCRRASGQDLVQWAFVPATNIVMSKGIVLGEYQSSKGISRSFCKTCGARVFWKSEDRKGLIDVAVGLMRSDAGSRAEDWLDWLTGRISFVEDAKNLDLVGALRDGMRMYDEEKHKQATAANSSG